MRCVQVGLVVAPRIAAHDSTQVITEQRDLLAGGFMVYPVAQINSIFCQRGLTVNNLHAVVEYKPRHSNTTVVNSVPGSPYETVLLIERRVSSFNVGDPTRIRFNIHLDAKEVVTGDVTKKRCVAAAWSINLMCFLDADDIRFIPGFADGLVDRFCIAHKTNRPLKEQAEE